MKEFTGFNESHVGEKVTDIIRGEGKIISFNNAGSRDYPVEVKFANCIEEYTIDGKYHKKENRSLYFGHGLQAKVTGEEIPEPKLICPVCGVEHKILTGSSTVNPFYFNYHKDNCPFFYSSFESELKAKRSMENLIKAMEKK